MNKDLYLILNVHRTASSRNIKKAYKDMAIKWHPDKNKSSEANQKFNDISYAYQILIDPQKRKDYDRCQQYNQPSTQPYSQQSNQQYSQPPNQQYYNYDMFFAQYRHTLRDPYEVFRDVMTIIDSINSAFNIVESIFNTNVNYLKNIDMSGCQTISFINNTNDYRWKICVYPNGTECGMIVKEDLDRLIEYSYMR